MGEILTLVALFEVLSADSPYCYSDVNVKPISVPTSQKKKKDALAPQTFFFQQDDTMRYIVVAKPDSIEQLAESKHQSKTKQK